MTTKNFSSPLLKFFFLVLLFSANGSFKSTAQYPHPLEEISNHYKTLAALSPLPNPEQVWMDTLTFPWTEYSKSALSNSLWRTVYLNEEDEAKLPLLIKFPANSSDQTRAELDYLLKLQNTINDLKQQSAN